MLDENYEKVLRTVLKKSRMQHPSKHLLCSLLYPNSQTIKKRRSPLGTVGKAKYFCGLLLMDTPELADEQTLTFNSSVWIVDLEGLPSEMVNRNG